MIPAMPNTDSQRSNADYTRYVGLGFTFVFIIGFFTFGGYLLDRLLGTLPLLLLLGLLVGFVGALLYLFRNLPGSGGE